MEPTLDKCPGYNLYIGGFIGLRRPQALKNCNITHIVSVLDWQFKDDVPLIRGYQHLHIPVDDVEDENLLEWFPRSNRFIQKGLENSLKKESSQMQASDALDEKGSGVYIHCAMGKSRSATILIAYLLWASRQPRQGQDLTSSTDMAVIPPKRLSVIKALELLRQGRPIVEPNEGFMDQLHMYEKMNCPSTEQELKSHKIYRRWMNKRQVEESLRVMQAPGMEHIIFEDESDDDKIQSPPSEETESSDSGMKEVAKGVFAPDGSEQGKTLDHPEMQATPQVSIKCRKCRHVLATTAFILDHQPPPHRDPNDPNHGKLSPSDGTPLPPSQCAHIFLYPLSWMKEALSEGKMEGRLTCPNKRCNTNIGKFAWSGLRCSCGGWVTPGFGIIRTKIDENMSRNASADKEAPGKASTLGTNSTDSLPAGMAALRLPPSMKRQGNL